MKNNFNTLSVVELTQILTRCPSISPQDKGCQKIIIFFLKKLGFNIKVLNIKDTYNFFAWKGNKKNKNFMFLGHTDVVPIGNVNKWKFPPFEGNIYENTLFGRGVVDMKGAIAAMLIAIRKFLSKYPKHQTRICFLITSDEESDGENGTIKVVEYLIRKKEKIDYCLIGEPTSSSIVGDTIKNGRRGSLTVNLTVYGIQGHVAYPQFSNNPIHSIVPFLMYIINKKWDKGNIFFTPSSLQITKIIVNNNFNNVIPGKCFIQFNIRFNNELTDILIKKIILKKLDYFNIKKYDIEWVISGQPFFTKKGKLFNITNNVIKKINNILPIISTDGGTSDGRFISKISSEIIELGLSNKSMHKENECVKISDLSKLTLIYYKILKNIIN